MSQIKQFSNKSVFFKYLSSSILGSAVGIFTGFFTYRYIEPSLLGIWALFTVYEVYASFTRLGIINGLGRELPYLYGKNKVEEATKMASAALYYSLLSNVLLLLALPYVLTNKSIDWSNTNYILAFIVIFIRLVLSSYTSYLSVTFRTNQSFNDLSRIVNILTILRLVSLVLIIFLGFLGVLIRELLLPFFEMVLMHLKRPINVLPKFSKNLIFQLFKTGFPLFLVSYLISFADTIPRLFLIKFATIEQLGLFSPIIIVLGLAIMLPNAISSYMYPKMSFTYGFTQDRGKVWRIILLTAVASLISSFPLFLGVFFLADYVYIIFPKYSEVSPYLKIASFAILFIGYKIGGLSFAVLKSWWIMIINGFAHLLLSVVSLFVLHLFITDVLKVASLALVFSYGFMYFFSICLAYKATH